MNAEAIAGDLGGAHKSGEWWMCFCPVHESATGSTASLAITDDPSKPSGIRFKCHGGCDWTDVLKALTGRGLINPKRTQTTGRSDFYLGGLGDPKQVYDYQDPEGRVVQRVARYEPPGKKKELRPWTRDDTGKLVCKGARGPLPLYRLPELLAHSERPVLVVEGEKCVHAALALLGDAYAVTTWSGGVGQMGKTDFEPLRNREVWLWPDADKPGMDAMRFLAAKLGNGATKIKLLDPGERPKGWDVADAVAENWSASDLATFIEERARPAEAAKPEPKQPEPEVDQKATSAWPAPLDLAHLATVEPQRPYHLIADWLPGGEVTLFAGHGGSGKSLIALHLAACLALGKPWWGLSAERKRVLYISAEDAQGVLAWRLSRIAAHMGVTVAELAPSLRVIDASDREAELMIDPGRGDAPLLTTLYDALPALMAEADVLILDGASDLYGASEIIRRHVRRFLRALRRLVRPDGAVLLLAHLDKAAARDSSASDRYSGSTAWNNSVRSRWALGVEDEVTITLTLAKANHARSGAEFKLRWDTQAHLYVAEPAPEGGIVGAIRERAEADAILAALRASTDYVPAATTGQRTAWHVLSARPECPDSMRNGREGRRAMWRALEKLRAMGAIREETIARNDRHKVRVLVASDIASAVNAGNA